MKTCAHDNRRLRVPDIAVIILVLVNSGYALTTGKITLLFVLLAVLAVTLLYIEGFHLCIPRNDTKLVVLFLIALSMILSFLVNGEFGVYKTYIHTALLILNGYLIRQIYTGKQVVNMFIQIMQIAAISALVVAVIDLVIPISSFAPTVVNGNGKEYYTLGIVNYQAETYFSGKRCCGLFWEPGMFSGMLALAALMDIYTRRDEKQFWRIVTYCMAIFVSFSTSGYVYYIMIGLMLVVRNKSQGISVILLVVLGVAVTIFSPLIKNLISNLFELLPLVFNKVKTQNLSYRTRVLSPFVDLLLMVEYPFGTGFADFSEIRTNMMWKMGAKTSITTSTLTYFGVTSGLLFFITYNISWVSGFLSVKRSIPLKIICILLYAMVLTSNPMFNNQLIWIVVFMTFPSYEENTDIIGKNRLILKVR